MNTGRLAARTEAVTGELTAKSVALEALRGVDLILTPACNLSCTYCYHDRRTRQRMTWSTARAAVDLLNRSGQNRLTLNFLGGEPLLQLDLIRRIVDHAERTRSDSKRCEYGISTNGMLLDDTTEEFLDAFGFDVQLSFDGVADAQDFRRVGSFGRLDETVDRLRTRRPTMFRERFSIAVTVTRANLAFLADSVDYFLAKGVRRIDLAH